MKIIQVYQLIETLQKLDPETGIVIDDGSSHCFLKLTGVSEETSIKEKHLRSITPICKKQGIKKIIMIHCEEDNWPSQNCYLNDDEDDV